MKTVFHSNIQSTLLPYETPQSVKIVFRSRVSLCQGSLQEYEGRDIDNDFGSEYSGSGETPGNGGLL